MPNEIELRDERQRAILAILRRTSVRRQQELVRQLGDRGFSVTQSSVSRDLRDLGVAKVRGRYLPLPAPTAVGGAATAPAAGGAAAIAEVLGEVAHYLRGVAPAGPHLTVVSTQVGAAQTVGIGLDRAGWPEIVGTIAGDDTVFVATAGAHEQTRLLHRLRALLAELPGELVSVAAPPQPRPIRPGARRTSNPSPR